uniref:NLR family, CARD domain containing 3-like n=1 Tax=Astyanax mexicanus TaxID=7994 RepID=W5K8J1_ASTMX
ERPPSSYGSMRSDDHDDVRLYRSDSPETGITALTQQQSSIHMEGAYQNLPPPPEGVGLQSGIEHETLSLPYLNLAELLWFKRSLCSQYKHHFEFSQLEDCDVLDVVDRLLERRGKGEALYYATRTLQNINKRPLADDLEIKCKRIVQHELRGSHSRRYYNLYEGTCRPGQQRFVSDVFAEPSIYIGGDWDINTDHEFHKPNFSSNQGTPIRASDIFRPLEGEGRIRTVLMTGVPGIGLTVAVQKFIMDWSDGLTNQDFQFVFSIPGKEMHLVKENDHSFLEMLANFYSETKNIDFLQNKDCPILFIIDALEFCRQPLNFKDNPEVCDVTTPAPADVLFTSLIKGTLLPHARIWITCHRVAARKIPSEYVSRFTDLKGLSNEKKDEYFTKRTKVPEVGVRVLEHIKRSQAMYNFCHLPLFCWIVGFIFERRLRSPENDEHPPALTNFYAQYMIVQTNRKIERYVGVGFEASRWKDTDKDFLVKMGKLALKMILEERDVFFEDDIAAMELDMEQVANRGGISAEVRRQGGYGRSGRAFSFVHYSMQEFMAAVYTYVTYRNKGKNVFEQQIKNKMAMLLKDRPVFDLYKLAVDRALASRNGHLDIFLRFLFGFVTPGTEAHLRGYLMPQHHPVPRGLEDVVKYVNKKIKENASPDRCKNLEWCLNELEEGKN